MKISCGGFELNENDFELNGETLSLKNGGGSDGGVMIVNDVNGTLDKTWQEIYDAGFSVLKDSDGLLLFCAGALIYDGEYITPYFNPMLNAVLDWTANSASGYPSRRPEPDPGPAN